MVIMKPEKYNTFNGDTFNNVTSDEITAQEKVVAAYRLQYQTEYDNYQKYNSLQSQCATYRNPPFKNCSGSSKFENKSYKDLIREKEKWDAKQKATKRLLDSAEQELRDMREEYGLQITTQEQESRLAAITIDMKAAQGVYQASKLSRNLMYVGLGLGFIGLSYFAYWYFTKK